MTNYDQLRTVLEKFNALATPAHQLDVARIVALRDQLAHGRTAANNPPFPLTLLKYDKPVKGGVPMLARSDMNESWFGEQRELVSNALHAVYDEQ